MCDPVRQLTRKGAAYIPLNVSTLTCGSGAPVPNSPTAVVWIYAAGTSRSLPVTTDSSGNGFAQFMPLPDEVGVCQYAVALPGQRRRRQRGLSQIVGMSFDPPSEIAQLTNSQVQTNTFVLTNLTAVPLTGITASPWEHRPMWMSNTPCQHRFRPTGSQVTVILTASATNPAPTQSTFYISYTCAQPRRPISLSSPNVSPLEAQLATIPATLIGTMVEGSQTVVQFTLTNSGAAASGRLQVSCRPPLALRGYGAADSLTGAKPELPRLRWP